MIDYKSLTQSDTDEILKDVSFLTKPLHHQAVTIVWAADIGNRLMLWHDVGTGKTLSSLYINQIWETKRLLIVCPNSVMHSWEEQIQLHSTQSFCFLKGSAEKRRELMQDSKANILIINYEGLRCLYGVQKKDKHSGKKRWYVNKSALKLVPFDSIVFDECHHLKSPDALQSKIAYEISSRVDNVIAMTGTPISTGYENLHNQYLVLDGGNTLGANRFRFLRQYFDQDFWGGWTIKDKENAKMILDRIAPVTLRYERTECFDLPTKTYNIRTCEMTAEQKKLTNDIIHGMNIETESGELTAADALHVGNKLSQITGGLLIMDDKTVHRLKKPPKLDLLQELVVDCPGKMIIFHNYIMESTLIEERLHKLKIPFAAIRGETKDKASEIKRFQNDVKCKVLLAHPKSGGEGLNLQAANTIVFYSNGTNGADVREQCEGRIWRYGQINQCMYFDLIVEDSIDEKRLEKTSNRKDMADKILQYIQNHKS